MPVDKGPVANTDQELFASAFTDEEQDFDDTDGTLEEMGDGPEGQHETDDAADEAEAAGEGEPEKPEGDEPEKPEEKAEEPEPEELKGLPPGAYKAIQSERKARQAAEASMRDAMQRHAQELAAANARFDRLLASQPVQQPQQQRSAAPQTPDPVLDPDGYGQYLRAQNEQFYAIKRTEETFAEQHETLGKEFEAAYIELQKLNPENPADRAIGNRIYTSPNPGKALMRWHREQAAL